MLLNRSHSRWAVFTVIATAVAVALYLSVFYPALFPWYHLPEKYAPTTSEHHSVGNSPLGLLYGSISYAIFIFAVLLNTRKKFPSARFGRVQTWLRAHIWLTILTLPLVFMHAAFRFGGIMTSSLMWLYLFVMLSGFYGLALQQFLPRQMKQQLTLETIYDEIPFLTKQILASALKMRGELRPAPMAVAAVGSETVAEAVAEDDPSVAALLEGLEHEVLPYLAARRPDHFTLAVGTRAEEYFRNLRLRVAPSEHAQVDQLAEWCEERRQMLIQTRYHRWMHGWLLVHVPSSFLLIILTGWHAIVALFLY